MKQPFYTDREHGQKPRITETINKAVWGGIYALVSQRLADNSLGQRFPETCPDVGHGICGYDDQMLRLTLVAEIPQIEWPISPDLVPETPVVLDFLEFIAASVGKPIEGYYHPYFRHHHLDFERSEGLAAFVSDLNFLFARNGIAYSLTDAGLAERILPEGLREILPDTIFHTGDSETDRLLEKASSQVTSPRLEARQDALESLWDAFERLKTLEDGADKKAKADALLDKVATVGSQLRACLGAEALALTQIGNTFHIRHKETTQEILGKPEQIDYLFHRMFAYIRHVLKATSRGG